LGQTRAPDEVVVVDDGSEDDTLTIARQFEPRVITVPIPHSGPSVARNSATPTVKSDYIAYLDSDDVWLPEKLYHFENAITSLGSPGVLISDFRRRIEDTGEWKPLSNTAIFPFILNAVAEQEEIGGITARIFDSETGLQLLLRGYPVWPSTLVVRRDLLEEVGGWNPNFPRAQDFDLMIRLVAREGLVYLDAPLTTVNVHAGHGSLFDYVSSQLDWDLKVLRAHVVSNPDFSPGQRGMARRFLGVRTIFRGDHARRHERRLESLYWYARGTALPGQWIRGPVRILETVLHIDRLREDRAAALELLPAVPESEESEFGRPEAPDRGNQPKGP
jgi:glycosyltransferase involved in cell wall biosynthesis